MLTETQKKQKRLHKSLKNKMFVFGLHSTSDDWPSNPSKKCWLKCKKNKKGPLSYQKIKCSFLDYVQLLMISQAIQGKKDDQDAKKQKRPPKSSKNKMFVFQLHKLLMIGWAIWAKNVDLNTKKWKRAP